MCVQHDGALLRLLMLVVRIRSSDLHGDEENVSDAQASMRQALEAGGLERLLDDPSLWTDAEIWTEVLPARLHGSSMNTILEQTGEHGVWPLRNLGSDGCGPDCNCGLHNKDKDQRDVMALMIDRQIKAGPGMVMVKGIGSEEDQYAELTVDGHVIYKGRKMCVRQFVLAVRGKGDPNRLVGNTKTIISFLVTPPPTSMETGNTSDRTCWNCSHKFLSKRNLNDHQRIRNGATEMMCQTPKYVTMKTLIARIDRETIKNNNSEVVPLHRWPVQWVGCYAHECSEWIGLGSNEWKYGSALCSDHGSTMKRTSSPTLEDIASICSSHLSPSEMQKLSCVADRSGFLRPYPILEQQKADLDVHMQEEDDAGEGQGCNDYVSESLSVSPCRNPLCAEKLSSRENWNNPNNTGFCWYCDMNDRKLAEQLQTSINSHDELVHHIEDLPRWETIPRHCWTRITDHRADGKPEPIYEPNLPALLLVLQEELEELKANIVELQRRRELQRRQSSGEFHGEVQRKFHRLFIITASLSLPEHATLTMLCVFLLLLFFCCCSFVVVLLRSFVAG